MKWLARAGTLWLPVTLVGALGCGYAGWLRPIMEDTRVSRAFEDLSELQSQSQGPRVAKNLPLLRDPWDTPYQRLKITLGEESCEGWASLGPNRVADGGRPDSDDLYLFPGGRCATKVEWKRGPGSWLAAWELDLDQPASGIPDGQEVFDLIGAERWDAVAG